MLPKEVGESLSYITYGLYIVTSVDGDKKNGLIVNTVFQVTAEPARVAISVNKNSLTHEYILKSGVFAAMPLAQSTTLPFIGIFGFRTGRNFDKFANVPYKMGPSGCPIVLKDTLSYMEVKVFNTVDMGTHTLFIGDVTGADILCCEHGVPLTYEYYHTVIKGKTPKGATHR